MNYQIILDSETNHT